jgi:glucose-6-phosphate 1-epimerase
MIEIRGQLRCALPESVRIEEGEGGLPLLHVRNSHAECSIYVHGAHVVSFRPRGGADLLWLSPHGLFREGSPIRGGIPICFPWFGARKGRNDLPLHGLVRTEPWNIESAEILADGRTRIAFSVENGEPPPEAWPHRFRLELSVTVGEVLEMALSVQNPENLPILCEDGFHTYFRVEDPGQCEVTELDGIEYMDRTKGDSRAVQEGPARFEGEMVHAFMHVPPVLELVDGDRRIRIEQEGMYSAVLWNPGERAGAANPEIRDAWKQFVCVESTNCLDCRLEIPAQGYHRSLLRLSSAGAC